MAEYLDYTGLSHFKDKLDDAYAEKSHTHDNYAPSVTGGYLPLSGGTMTGTITTKGSLYDRISQNTTAATPTGGGIDMNNSDITRANAIIWADQASVKEGLMFPSSNFVTWDSIWANGVGEIHADSYNKTTGATTVRYIPKSSAVSKGNANTPVYLTNGFLEPCTDLKAKYDINTTEISPTNGVFRSNLGNPSLFESGVIPQEFNNKMGFMPQSYVLYETSDDGGQTWQEYTVSESNHKNLWGGTSTGSLFFYKVVGSDSTNYKTIDVSGDVDYRQVRITMTSRGYVYLNMFYMYSSGGGSSFYIKLEKHKKTTDIWETINESNGVGIGWPAHCVIKHGSIPYSTGDNSSYYDKVRITIYPLTLGGTKTENGVTYASNPTWGFYKFAYYGGYPYSNPNIYSIDGDKNVTFPASLIATTSVTSPKFIGGLACYPSARPSSANTRYGDGLLRYYLATTSMTTGKPPSDAMILHMGWDNTGGYDSQLAIGTGANNKLYYRNMNGGSTWNSWKTVATTDDIPTLPTLATVATSGSYNDLTDKPTIPTTDVAITNAEIDSIVNGTYS